jgi:hypothetical protein
MQHYTWSGVNGDEPTIYVFEYGLINAWKDGISDVKHWHDDHNPPLKKEVMDNIALWGGSTKPGSLVIEFPTEQGALMWKLKYPVVKF